MSAGERLPGTPVPGHIWDGYEGIKIAGDTWGNPTISLLYYSMEEDKPGMRGKVPAKHLA